MRQQPWGPAPIIRTQKWGLVVKVLLPHFINEAFNHDWLWETNEGKKGPAGCWCDKTNNYGTKTTQEKQMKGEKNNDPAACLKRNPIVYGRKTTNREKPLWASYDLTKMLSCRCWDAAVQLFKASCTYKKWSVKTGERCLQSAALFVYQSATPAAI